MPRYQFPSFSIDLPPESRDVSTYGFVLPIGKFHPSVTIKCQPSPVTPFDAFVRAQCDAMAGGLEGFRLLEGPAAAGDDPDTWQIVCEWGRGESRFRQIHRFARRGQIVFQLTGTALADAAPELAAELDRILGTFQVSRAPAPGPG
jgi:hypothetical protein